MKSPLYVLCMIGGLGAASMALAGPSFDCRKATTKFEKTICGDAGLSDLDGRLGEAYRKALAGEPDRVALIGDQQVWLRARVESCVGPTAVPDQAKSCIAKAYDQRIEVLSDIAGIGPVSCTPPMSVIAQSVCADPELLQQDRALEDHFQSVLHASKSAFRHWELERDQREWRKYLIEGVGPTPLWEPVRDELPGWLASQYALRNTALSLGEISAPFGPPMPVKFAPDWWGVDLLHANAADVPEWTGVKQFPIKLPDGDLIVMGDTNCPGPLQHSVAFTTPPPLYTTLIGRYFIQRLSRPKSFEYNHPRCANGYGDTWTADFEPLSTEFRGQLSDGTFLALIGDRYLVRFRGDMTSPFFEGRTDLVSVPETELDRLSSDDGPSLRAVKAVIDDTARRQSLH
jgi:uncharacterized protein